MRKFGLGIPVMILLGTLTGCEDKEKVALNEKLGHEVIRLHAEVEELSKGVEEEGSDKTDLDKLQQEAETRFELAKNEVAGLEAQLENARNLREEAEKDFEAYQENYPIGN